MRANPIIKHRQFSCTDHILKTIVSDIIKQESTDNFLTLVNYRLITSFKNKVQIILLPWSNTETNLYTILHNTLISTKGSRKGVKDVMVTKYPWLRTVCSACTSTLSQGPDMVYILHSYYLQAQQCFLHEQFTKIHDIIYLPL